MKTIHHVADECIDCQLCVKECAFLQENGTPGELCDRFLHSMDKAKKNFAFNCNLCSLCSTVCPLDLQCGQAFLEMRQEIQKTQKRLPQHRSICSYEKIGNSSLFSAHITPANCHSVFFPGCTLAATRSEITEKTYRYLQQISPSIGLVLHCCSKPSHDLGLHDTFEKQFGELIQTLKDKGITRIITACPSCYVTFKEYAPEFTTITVYEMLAKHPPEISDKFDEKVTIQDTCVTRNEPEIHKAIRSLSNAACNQVFEMEHTKENTICCGEGGAAAFVAQNLTNTWKDIRNQERGTSPLITYCAGCSTTFGTEVPNMHILDLLFNGSKARANEKQRTKSPFTYIQRLLLKFRTNTARNT